MVATTATSPAIELRRLHRYFGATQAVYDVTFDVPEGQVFGYIGPNGAGKTTSMRILATLDLPTFGDALVDGFSVSFQMKTKQNSSMPPRSSLQHRKSVNTSGLSTPKPWELVRQP